MYSFLPCNQIEVNERKSPSNSTYSRVPNRSRHPTNFTACSINNRRIDNRCKNRLKYFADGKLFPLQDFITEISGERQILHDICHLINMWII